MARELGWTEEELQNLKYAALLHDIGKIGVPDSVLNKPGKLTEVEYNLIKEHTVVGGEILKDIAIIEGLDSGAKYHHERYDGKGYPYGLKGEDIPFLARIICVADAYDAMTSKRIYRRNLEREKIREELVNGRGTQFDPNLADVFLRLFDSDSLKLSVNESEEIHSMQNEGSTLLTQIVMNMEEGWKKERETDYVTGLLNRQNGEEKVVTAMEQGPGCLAIIDMDNLKTINDMYGHFYGDFVIRAMADILKENMQNAIVSRMGGDEFLFYMKNVTEEEAIERIRKIQDGFNKVKAQNAEMEPTSLTIGLCMTVQSDVYADIYQKADKALYYKKMNGKDGYYFYKNAYAKSTESVAQADLRRIAESVLKQGMYKGTFGLEYREFTKICNFINNMAIRYHHNIQLLMITLEPVKGSTYFGSAKEDAMKYMEKAIKSSLRSVDVCTRYSSEQFLIILNNADKNSITLITNRIFDQYYKMNTQKLVTISYDVVDLSTFGKE